MECLLNRQQDDFASTLPPVALSSVQYYSFSEHSHILGPLTNSGFSHTENRQPWE